MRTAARVVAILLVMAAGAGAQERTSAPIRVGFTAGTTIGMNLEIRNLTQEEAWVGVLLHPTERLVVRPSLVFTGMTRNEEDLLGGTSYLSLRDIAVGAALAGFYYLPPRAGLSLYAGPELTYLYLGRNQYTETGARDLDRWHMLHLNLLFGAQYMLGERFGFQAELGAGVSFFWTHTFEWNGAGTLITEEMDTLTMFGTRGAYLGAVFYLD